MRWRDSVSVYLSSLVSSSVQNSCLLPNLLVVLVARTFVSIGGKWAQVSLPEPLLAEASSFRSFPPLENEDIERDEGRITASEHELVEARRERAAHDG